MLQSIRSVLAVPAVYNLWWKVVGGRAWAKVLVSEYIPPGVGARTLEIGCGPGTIARYLPQADYVGFDVSSGTSKWRERVFRMRNSFASE